MTALEALGRDFCINFNGKQPMPFEIESFTAVRLVDVIVLSHKNRAPDEDPGAKLSIVAEMTNDCLAMFDGSLRSALYTKAGKAKQNEQGALDGVDPVSDAPDLTGIGAHVKVLKWAQEMTGYSLEIDLGLGTKKSNLRIDDCTVGGWRIYPKAGGTVTVKFNVESADVSEQAFGKLAKQKSREISMVLLGPSTTQQEIGA